MPRYIDADSFSERFDMMCDAGGVLAPVTEAVREMVKVLIQAEPTADVQEVKHGRWLVNKHTDTVICSECKKCFGDEKPYCSNCGAKMDKEG